MAMNEGCNCGKNTERQSCPNKTINEQDCPCANEECVRHGTCCACIQFHLERGNKPACMR